MSEELSAAERIVYIRQLLATGVRSTTVDGVTTSYDLRALQQELKRLEDEAGLRTRRPRTYHVTLRNA